MKNCNSLSDVRKEIDHIDQEIIALIAKRGNYVKQASRFKKSASDVKAPSRVDAVIEKVRALAAEKGADPDMIESLYREMINKFIDMETEVFNSQA